MKNIDLDHWGVIGNKAAISLSHLHAKFYVKKNDEFIYYQLIVTDSNMETLTFNFYTLEDVISFTEDVINKCWSREEVLDKYQKMYEVGLFSLPGGMKPPRKGISLLSPEDVEQAIIDYFGSGKNYDVSVDSELYVDFNRQQQIVYYLVEHLDYDGIQRDISCMLTNGDIKNALSAYVETCGYELVDFKYKGGIRKVGFFIDEDTPHYEGVSLNVKKMDAPKQKKLGRNNT